MSSWDYKPGINKVDANVANSPDDDQHAVHLQFELNGLSKLVTPVQLGGTKRDFYIYIFLIFYNGGKDFEIVSSAHHHIQIEKIDDKALFQTVFVLPPEHPYQNEDFILSYYSLDIIYTEFAAEDGADIGMMLSNPYNKLFSTKLEIKK